MRLLQPAEHYTPSVRFQVLVETLRVVVAAAIDLLDEIDGEADFEDEVREPDSGEEDLCYP